jgi:hypothetical protein
VPSILILALCQRNVVCELLYDVITFLQQNVALVNLFGRLLVDVRNLDLELLNLIIFYLNCGEFVGAVKLPTQSSGQSKRCNM